MGVPRALRAFTADLDTYLPLGSLRRRLIRGTFWALVGALFSQSLNLVASVLVGRFLGTSRYGELGMVMSTLGMFGVFAGLSLGLTANKHVAEFRTSDPARAGRIIGLSSIIAFFSATVMAVTLFLLAPTIAQRTIHAPQLLPALRIGCLVLFLDALTGAQTGALAGFEAFKTIAKVNLALGLLNLPLMVIGTWLWGVTGAVAARVLWSASAWSLNHLALAAEARKAAVPVSYRHARLESPILWRFSLPALLANLVVMPVVWLANTMLVARLDGYAQLGVFNAANQWRVVILFAPSLLGQVIIPVLSERLSAGDTRRVRRTLLFSIMASAAMAVPLAIIVWLIGPQVMGLYGSAFVPGSLVLTVVAFTAVLLAVQQPVGHVITASGRMWTGFLMNLGWALAFLAFFMGLRERGALGLALAYLLAYAVHALWTFAFSWWMLRHLRLAADEHPPESIPPLSDSEHLWP